MRRQAETYGSTIVKGRVDGLKPVRGGFRIDTAEGPLHARSVILATGVTDNMPPLPEFADGVARGLVRICPICDGFEVIGQSVGVIGRDDHCAREALFLRTYSDDVTFIHVGPEPLPAKLKRDLAKGGVAIVESAMSAVRIEKRRISALDFDDGEVRRFDVIYSALGVTPQTDLAVQAGARLDAGGRLLVDEHQQTSVPGLYAAGDVVRGLNQISTAEGEGAIAATAVHNRLRSGG